MKRLWVLPLAAILCGRPVNPPRLKSPIPLAKEGCLASAEKHFLLAYAYQEESPAHSRHWRQLAEKELGNCDEPTLRARIRELRNSAP